MKWLTELFISLLWVEMTESFQHKVVLKKLLWCKAIFSPNPPLSSHPQPLSHQLSAATWLKHCLVKKRAPVQKLTDSNYYL